MAIGLWPPGVQEDQLSRQAQAVPIDDVSPKGFGSGIQYAHCDGSVVEVLPSQCPVILGLGLLSSISYFALKGLPTEVNVFLDGR